MHYCTNTYGAQLPFISLKNLKFKWKMAAYEWQTETPRQYLAYLIPLTHIGPTVP